jgi:hypothetical protein
MIRSLVTLGFLFLAASTACAQPLVIDPAHRPDDFSNIVGKYSIKASAEPTEVHVEEAITLRIEITGEGPAKYEPKFKDLRLFPDSRKNDFYIQELPDQREVLRDTKTWVFVYRFKPKNVKVKEIGDLCLCYYDPQFPDKIKYVTKFAEPPIPIKVTPKPNTLGDKVIPPDVNSAPASFYHQADSSRVLAPPRLFFPISNIARASYLVLLPLVCLVGALAWRHWFPDDARRTRRHRDQSAARAIAHLRANDAPAWDVVRDYLRERFDFPATDATPTEVAAFLKRRGFAKAVGEQALAFLQTCDALRFNASPDLAQRPLAEDAVRLIEAMEADPCARG